MEEMPLIFLGLTTNSSFFGILQVHHPLFAEAGRWVLPLRGTEQDGSSLAEKIRNSSSMYVCGTSKGLKW